jgi:ribosomal protein S18 acetylase RimI-like enzyme
MGIRRLAVPDAAPYRALMLEAYEAHPDAFTSTVSERAALPLAWWEARVAVREGGGSVWGAFEADRLVGVAGLGMESRERLSHRATLFGMYVRPEHRGRGIADRLVEAVLRDARSRPEVVVVQLTVSEGNRGARALYERHGFAAFGVEPYAVRLHQGFVTKVHMWRAVRAASPAPAGGAEKEPRSLVQSA